MADHQPIIPSASQPIKDAIINENFRRFEDSVSTNNLLTRPISTVTLATTLNASHYTLLVDATAGATTVSLPPAATYPGRVYVIKKMDASANNVVIDGSGSETIDGAATKTTNTQYAGWQIQSNGTNWIILP